MKTSSYINGAAMCPEVSSGPISPESDSTTTAIYLLVNYCDQKLDGHKMRSFRLYDTNGSVAGRLCLTNLAGHYSANVRFLNIIHYELSFTLDGSISIRRTNLGRQTQQLAGETQSQLLTRGIQRQPNGVCRTITDSYPVVDHVAERIDADLAMIYYYLQEAFRRVEEMAKVHTLGQTAVTNPLGYRLDLAS